MSTRSFACLSLVALASSLTACAVPAAPSTGDEVSTPTASENALALGRVGSHGMVLFGSKEQAFLSHIPMFHAPHDVQLVTAVRVEGPANLPNDFGDRLYTFVPERLSLDALRLGKLTTFKGTIYLGNFEDGGRPLPGEVVVTVTRVVHQHLLVASTPAAPHAQLLVANATATYAIDRIDGAPGRDKIARVVLGAGAPTAAELGTGVFRTDAQVTFTSATVLSCLVGPDFAAPCP